MARSPVTTKVMSLVPIDRVIREHVGFQVRAERIFDNTTDRVIRDTAGLAGRIRIMRQLLGQSTYASPANRLHRRRYLQDTLLSGQ